MKTTLAALSLLLGTAAQAAPVTYEIDVSTSIGFQTAVETYTLRLTFDPDVATGTRSEGNGNIAVDYGSDEVQGVLLKGTQRAQVDGFRIGLSATPITRRESIAFVFTLDDQSDWTSPPPGFPEGFWDGDQDDGLDYGLDLYTQGNAQGDIDVNSIGFSFGTSNSRTDPIFGAGMTLQGVLDSGLANAQFASVSGSVFGPVNGRGGFGNATLFNGITGQTPELLDVRRADAGAGGTTAVPLPAAGWMLLAGVGGLAWRGRRAR